MWNSQDKSTIALSGHRILYEDEIDEGRNANGNLQLQIVLSSTIIFWKGTVA